MWSTNQRPQAPVTVLNFPAFSPRPFSRFPVVRNGSLIEKKYSRLNRKKQYSLCQAIKILRWLEKQISQSGKQTFAINLEQMTYNQCAACFIYYFIIVVLLLITWLVERMMNRLCGNGSPQDELPFVHNAVAMPRVQGSRRRGLLYNASVCKQICPPRGCFGLLLSFVRVFSLGSGAFRRGFAFWLVLLSGSGVWLRNPFSLGKGVCGRTLIGRRVTDSVGLV